ncbi:hypothetical protein ASPWEDRAFT_34188 [Aspergillus wentii DTO 134E9]|uniref:Rhodopsin domain-containing protein n=1 Tax=Aspergillus wentii DTO 134E9 TaxID=1073089 RepID=A0A1L9S0N4_ASPWE|nr:uncharacterized protein ASPWEDRAFT_34188 [Aspergillus wentii DTO 134E9]KAI9931265.1 hypothetical protein MW887_010927 [Aspergillus wentii]OJJ40722.1 hypothetical protein ASPWEDRAFT_34188 [Aspergillus wentii DTO 134E9]
MPTVTAENLSPVVAIVAWFLLVVSCIGVFGRLGFKYLLARKFDVDDYLICAALILSALQTGCIAIATDNGYGKPLASLDDDHIGPMLKAGYASEILYIACLCCSKLSSVAFGAFLMQRTRSVEWVLTLSIVVWGIIGIFAVAFQCKLPEPWNDLVPSRCFNRIAWWNYFEVTNLLIEVVLIVFPILMILDIQMSTTKKITVIVCFLTRILVIGAIICELYYHNRLLTSKDLTLDSWPVAVCMEIVQCFGILIASVPHLKPFLSSLQSTGLRLYQIPGEENVRAGYVYGKWKMSPSRQTDTSTSGHELSGLHRGINRTVVTAMTSPRAPDWETQSQTSQSHIIRETKTWVVEEQVEGGGPSEIRIPDPESERCSHSSSLIRHSESHP